MRTILSGGQSASQAGPQSEAGRDDPVHYFPVFLQKLFGLSFGDFVFGAGNQIVPRSFRIHGKRNENHSGAAFDNGWV